MWSPNMIYQNYWRAYKTKDVSRILVRDKTNHQPFSSTFDSLTEYSASLIQVDGSEKLKISKIWSFPLNFIDWKHFMRKPEYTNGLKDEHNAFLLQRSKDLYIIWPYDGQAGKTKTPRSSSQAFRRVLAFKGGSNTMLSIFSLWNQESQLPWRSREGKQFSMIS